MSATYFSKLRTASMKRESLLCIGLDPDPKFIAGGLAGAVKFCLALIDSTSDLACCYKPNAAFWEQYGPKGWEGLATVRQAVPPDIPVLFDCKRADVPNTMSAYASAVFDAMEFDAATIHAYHGADSLSKFTEYADRGIYVVCHTSNPGRTDLQQLRHNEQPLYMAVADLAMRSNNKGNTGVVVGATAPIEAAAVRAAFPTLPFLLPRNRPTGWRYRSDRPGRLQRGSCFMPDRSRGSYHVCRNSSWSSSGVAGSNPKDSRANYCPSRARRSIHSMKPTGECPSSAHPRLCSSNWRRLDERP